MDASFDKAALKYDQTFTNTEIGQLQRSLVYAELSKHLTSVHNILEINCGTGEDAIWLAQQNFKVTATDISSKMIEAAKNKKNLSNLNFTIANINSITTTFEGSTFDLLFSNFGGLNVETRIRKFLQKCRLYPFKKGQTGFGDYAKKHALGTLLFFGENPVQNHFQTKKRKCYRLC
jgi:ubiquinone/menaquinone biosynthesis C-methylase UbiE